MARYSLDFYGSPEERRRGRRGSWRGERRTRGAEEPGRARFGRGGRFGRLPGKPARGYPVHGIHTYDLDYGNVAGGPDTDYSGRAGYDVDRDWLETPRGPYTPRLAEIGRESRRRRLYGEAGGRYSGRGRGGFR